MNLKNTGKNTDPKTIDSNREETEEYYRRIAKKYDETRVGNPKQVFFNKLKAGVIADYSGDGRILDVGCGTGMVTQYLRGKVYAGDVNPEMLEIAKKRTRAFLSVFSAYNLPFRDNFFDAVISIKVIYHLKEPKKAIKEIERVLKTGGKAVIDYPSKHSIGGIVFKILHGETDVRMLRTTIEEFEKMTSLKIEKIYIHETFWTTLIPPFFFKLKLLRKFALLLEKLGNIFPRELGSNFVFCLRK